MSLKVLKARWQRWWDTVGAVGDSQQVFQEIVTRYSESHRFYHTLQHLTHCFEELDQVKHLALDPASLELSVWLHDIFYNPQAKDNEERSARLALAICRAAKLPTSFGRQVASHIRATQHLCNTLAEGDTKLLLDIDLAILGQSEERFVRYEKQIRKEYAWVKIREYRQGRRAILERFARRPILYLTPFFHDRYEAQARRNLEASIRALRAHSR